MFHPHSEGPRSVLRRTILSKKKTCAEPTSGKAGFDGLKMASRVMSLVLGVLLVPGTLCSVFGPQGVRTHPVATKTFATLGYYGEKKICFSVLGPKL